MLSEQEVRDMRQGFLDSMGWAYAGPHIRQLQFTVDLLTAVLEEEVLPDPAPEPMPLHHAILRGLGVKTTG